MTTSRVFPALALVALVSTLSAAAGAQKAAHPPALADLQTRLKFALHAPCPKATFAYEDDGTTLAVEYHAQPFMVHTIYKTGEIAAKAHQERGPNQDGFRLTLAFREEPLLSQLALPQDRHEPYWTRSVDAIEWAEDGKPRHVYVGLAFGHRTDQAVLKAIKAALADFARSKS